MLGYVGPILGPCWAYVGPMLAYVGPMLAHVEPSWDLCWGPDWAIYVETSPKPRKNRCFFNIAKMKILAVEGPETPQKTMFFNTASKIRRKLQGLQWFGSRPRVSRGWVGGRGAAPITFGYYRRPPARTRARGPRPDLCECGNPQHKPKMAPWARLGPTWAP